MISPFFGIAESVEKKVRLGIVGGNFGTAFFFHEHPNATVVAVSDLIPARCDRLKETYKCDVGYESLEKLIRDKNVDAVFIATPAPDHVRHAVMALKAGKHVLSAVPAAWTLEECHLLVNTVRQTGLTYMMAETSYYRQITISARRFYREGQFGDLFYTTMRYHHPGLEALYFENGKRTWRHGVPPMHYPTHCTSFLVGVTGERLTEVTCTGWGDDDPILKGNVYKNPFWNETALFKTNRGNTAEVEVWWRGAVQGTESAKWYGSRMSLYGTEEGAQILRATNRTKRDSGGFIQGEPSVEDYATPAWWNTDMLPVPLRHDSGHGGSHTFLTHEFIDALVHGRRPAVDVYEAVAYTAPGIVAHQSALKGGVSLKVPSFDP